MGKGDERHSMKTKARERHNKHHERLRRQAAAKKAERSKIGKKS
jgi:hypothetical protein